MTVTTGMVGQGFYDRNSAPQWAAIEAVLPWVEEAIGEMALVDPPATVALADFGCSEGRNSIQVMRRLVPAIRARTARPVQTIHSDLPTNDYASLLRNLRADGRPAFGEGVCSAVVPGLDVRPAAAAALGPPGHDLQRDRLPQPASAAAPARLHPAERPRAPCAGSARSAPRTGRRARRRRWPTSSSFARARAAELVPGGKLLIEVFGSGPSGRTCDGIYDALNGAVLEVLDAGLIDRAAYEAFYQPVYFRTLEELTAPFAVAGRAAQATVPARAGRDLRGRGALRRRVSPHRRCRGVRQKRFTDFFRAFTEPVLRAAFPAREPDRFADNIFGRAERLVRDHPERYEFHYVSVAALMTRLP